MRFVALVVALLVLGGGTAAAEPRVVGGGRVSIADHPWVVYLADVNGFQFCGGTLVAPDKVVTAAHCVAGGTPRGVRVVAGREDKQGKAGEVVKVTRIWVHPDYAAAERGRDVAVLTLRDAVGYEVLPMVAEDDDEPYAAGTPALVLGWGRTSEQGESSRYLRGATVPLVADRACHDAYPQYDETSMVCAGLDEGGVDTCQGDSGGPLVVGGELAGMTSWGEGCARPGKPGVYTRLGAYRDLVDAQVNS